MVENRDLGPTAALAEQDGCSGHGIFLLTSARQQLGASGQHRLELELEDSTGCVIGYGWPEAHATIACPGLPSPVAVRATVATYNGEPRLKVQGLTGIAPSEVPLAASLLPVRRCPEIARPALARLAQLERELPPPLDQFLRYLLLDPRITLPILSCRASVHHHHAYPGGLLVHSTEQLSRAADLAHAVLPDDDWAPHLCQLAYLLHDVGKLYSVGTERRSLYPFAERHELLTIELLAPHLRWLELRDPALAAGLRHVFGYLATPAQSRRPADYAIAEIVQNLDQLSAASFNRRDLNHLLHERPQAAMRTGRVVRFPDGQATDPGAQRAR